jgi:hypothetical protein
MDFVRHSPGTRAQGLRVPTPLPASLPLAGLALVALAMAATGFVPVIAALAVAASCALLATVRGVIASHHRRVLRDRADELIRKGVRVNSGSTLLSWRSAELTSEWKRKPLARSLDHIVRELDGRLLPGAVPLNRVAARPHVDLLRALAERLRATERQVSPRGVALVDELVTDGFGSPLYVRERAPELRATLERCLAALDDTTVGTVR